MLGPAKGANLSLGHKKMNPQFVPYKLDTLTIVCFMFSRFEFMSRVLNNDHIHPISQQIFGRNWLPASEKLHEKNDFHVG